MFYPQPFIGFAADDINQSDCPITLNLKYELLSKCILLKSQLFIKLRIVCYKYCPVVSLLQVYIILHGSCFLTFHAI